MTKFISPYFSFPRFEMMSRTFRALEVSPVMQLSRMNFRTKLPLDEMSILQSSKMISRAMSLESSWFTQLGRMSSRMNSLESSWLTQLGRMSSRMGAQENSWFTQSSMKAFRNSQPQFNDLLFSRLSKVAFQGTPPKWKSSSVLQLARLFEVYKSPLEKSLTTQLIGLQKAFGGNAGGSGFSKLFEVSNVLSDRFSVGTVAAKILAVGAAGGFEPALIEAAVRAANLVERGAPDSAESKANGEVFPRSAVADAVAEVDKFVRDTPTGAPEELFGRTVELLAGLSSSIAGRLINASSRLEIGALLNLLNLVVAIVYGQLNYMLAVQGVGNGASDLAKLRAEVKEVGSAQLEEQRKTREALERVLQEMQEKKEGLNYRVVRRTSLWAGRTAKSDVVMELRPGQPVVRIQRHYKWVEVECYDYLSGKTRTGWVLNENLRTVDGDSR
ncbi:hypothetical protein [Corallococcus carmarthensis]|uniref:hypothetical protein n=1 Tax=Corallococcus carmarthensis TaxID=2316728 RepID=UPI00148BA8B5|nr:hypothetical protein [Corallococcus carmarthensis]NOK17399.1 hypothetical protein [Corallococcus carmarthensis]